MRGPHSTLLSGDCREEWDRKSLFGHQIRASHATTSGGTGRQVIDISLFPPLQPRRRWSSAEFAQVCGRRSGPLGRWPTVGRRREGHTVFRVPQWSTTRPASHGGACDDVRARCLCLLALAHPLRSASWTAISLRCHFPVPLLRTSDLEGLG